MRTVRVATFNTHCCLGTDAILDLERVAEVIRESGADFLALQELDRGRARTGEVDQPATIAELTGLDVRFWPTIERGAGGAYGVAVAARGHVDATAHLLPRVAAEEPRLAIVARWAELSIVAAHLATQNDPARPAHLRALASLATDLAADGPVVVMGDFNSHRHQLGPLIAAGLSVGPEHTTFVRPGRQLDYVMMGPGVEVARSWTIASPASDHLCLVADLEVDEHPGGCDCSA